MTVEPAISQTGPGRPRFPEAARELLRNTLLDSAAELMREYRWSEISMAAIASRAGVSRQTLYKQFGSREEFAQWFVLREADRFLTQVEAAIAHHVDEPRAAITAGFSTFLQQAEENPMVRAIIEGDDADDGLLRLFTTQGRPIVVIATDRLARFLSAQWSWLPQDLSKTASEAIVRLAISHAALPTATPAETGESISRLLGPYIDLLAAN